VNILIYAIGNPGRQDDGVGALLADTMQQALESTGGAAPGTGSGGCRNSIRFDANYQLNVEDAEAISHFDIVVFADASVDDEDAPFRLQKLQPEPTASFSTHSVNPGGILALCEHVFGSSPRVYMLAVRGYDWEFGAPVTARARHNATCAAEFLLTTLCGEQGDGQRDESSLLDEFVS
jgi:hydrogenase maturation protease